VPSVGGTPLRPASPDTSPRNNGWQKEMVRHWDEDGESAFVGLSSGAKVWIFTTPHFSGTVSPRLRVSA
jgi:hypothetical protein